MNGRDGWAIVQPDHVVNPICSISGTSTKKWLVDIFDGQKESGSVSDVCPAYWPFYGDNVTWAGTHYTTGKNAV